MSLPPFVLEHEKGSGVIIFDVLESDNGETICGIRDLTGHLDLPPKAWLRVVRETLAEIERRARDAGCAEIRWSGRDWSRVCPGYERIPGDAPNLYRKRLT